jgi:hypothetical protein
VNLPVAWWWVALAGLAVVVALASASVPGVVVVAATCAAGAAGLGAVETIVRHRSHLRPTAEAAPAHPGGLREAFVGGAPGREDIVAAFDLLERQAVRPDLRVRHPAEVEAIVRLPPDEFRRYVAHRLDELERSS